MQDLTVQSNAVNTETEGAIESACIKRVELENMEEFSSPPTKKTVRNNEVSISSRCP